MKSGNEHNEGVTEFGHFLSQCCQTTPDKLGMVGILATNSTLAHKLDSLFRNDRGGDIQGNAPNNIDSQQIAMVDGEYTLVFNQFAILGVDAHKIALEAGET